MTAHLTPEQIGHLYDAVDNVDSGCPSCGGDVIERLILAFPDVDWPAEFARLDAERESYYDWGQIAAVVLAREVTA